MTDAAAVDTAEDQEWDDGADVPAAGRGGGVPEQGDDGRESGDDDGTDIPSDGTRRHGRAGGRLTRQLVGRVVAKYRALSDADGQDVAVLAAVVGSRPDPADLTGVIESDGRAPVQPLDDTVALADAAGTSPYEVMLAAMGLDRDRQRACWAVLAAAGAAEGALPVKESAAAVALAKAAGAITADHRAVFDRARALARK